MDTIHRSDVEPDAPTLRKMEQRLAMLQQVVQAWPLGLGSREAVIEIQGLLGVRHPGRDAREGPSGRGQTSASG